MAAAECPACRALNAPMGTLGQRRVYSCRFCGMEWSVALEDDNCWVRYQQERERASLAHPDDPEETSDADPGL